MTVFKSKYQRRAFISGLFFLTGYLFQDFLFNKLWILSIPILILSGILFLTIIISGLIKRDIHVLPVLIILIGIITLVELLRSDLFKSEKIIEATLSDDLSNIHMILRKDSSFQMISSTMFGENHYKGNYKLIKDRIIFLDKPYENNFIPDTLRIINDKIILRFENTGKPDTSFASYFSINLNKVKKSP
jgi:hypothetical protein